MTTQAVKFQGTKLHAMSGTDATEVGEVTGLDGPGGQAPVIDATHSLSVAREKLMGLPDEGQITVTLNSVWDDSGQVELKSRRSAQTLDDYRIQINDAASTEMTFQAYCLGFSYSSATDGKWDARVQLEISGPVTIA